MESHGIARMAILNVVPLQRNSEKIVLQLAEDSSALVAPNIYKILATH